MLFHLHLHTAHTNMRKNTGSPKIYCDAQSSHHLTFTPPCVTSAPIHIINWMEKKYPCLLSMPLRIKYDISIWKHWQATPRIMPSWEKQTSVRVTKINNLNGSFFCVYIHFCLNQKSVLLVFTWMALLCREKPAFNVPSNRPIESVLRSKGVTSVTYFAPDQGFSRPIAHSSVSPPTPSKTTSNLEVEKETDNLVNILLEMW